MTPTNATARGLPIVFSCAGRRVELLQAFRAAAARLGVALHVIATDAVPTAPALLCADEAVIVPPIRDPDYVPALLDLVARRAARALVPTIDTDLLVLSENRERFAALGCTALVGEPQVVAICRDKLQTFEFLSAHGVDTPLTRAAADALARKDLRFPCFIKPRGGSAARHAHRVNDLLDLEYYARRIEDAIVQEFVEGTEHTLDVYVGLSGLPRCVVPRRRWQVRTGEVVKGVVVKDPRIMDAGRHVAQLLGPSVRGLVTLQCIVTPQSRIRFIEINPRFGGGAPMSIAAGADFPAWLIQELMGRTPEIRFDGFQHGLCMLRYDWSAFVQLDEDLAPAVRPPLRPFPPFE